MTDFDIFNLIFLFDNIQYKRKFSNHLKELSDIYGFQRLLAAFFKLTESKKN